MKYFLIERCGRAGTARVSTFLSESLLANRVLDLLNDGYYQNDEALGDNDFSCESNMFAIVQGKQIGFKFSHVEIRDE